MEGVSGQPLAEFFNDWIYGEGFPSYKGEWRSERATAVRVTLSQTTSHPSVPFFEMPVPLQFKSRTRDTILTVNHTRNGEVFTLDPGFIADTMIIDPQLWILSKNNQTLKTGGLPEQTNVLVFPNPATNTVTVYLPPVPSQATGIRLYNALGQEVYQKSTTSSGNEEVIIPLHSLASGMYWVQIDRGSSRDVVKLMVVK